MLNFIFWGIALNVYSLVLLWIIIKAIYPKDYKSPYDKRYSLILKIALVFIPYFFVVLFIISILGMVVLKFDYKEIERYRSKVKKD
ncbi:hypothetical protein ACHJH3_01885 [Campylobacter sp. MOP7]|uniref:hypothetical protein n=1 Tax=Campylobacter canis TaxID=3378588 RepID=UPI00387EADD2